MLVHDFFHQQYGTSCFVAYNLRKIRFLSSLKTSQAASVGFTFQETRALLGKPRGWVGIFFGDGGP